MEITLGLNSLEWISCMEKTNRPSNQYNGNKTSCAYTLDQNLQLHVAVLERILQLHELPF